MAVLFLAVVLFLVWFLRRIFSPKERDVDKEIRNVFRVCLLYIPMVLWGIAVLFFLYIDFSGGMILTVLSAFVMIPWLWIADIITRK